jgi:hypothetical protein
MTPATKHKLFNFFEGSGKGIFLIIAGIATGYFYSTFVTIPMPGNYVEKSTFATLSQAHAKDIEKLQIEKMDRSEYEKRHEELKQQFARDSQDTKKMVSEMYSFLLGKRFKHKDNEGKE